MSDYSRVHTREYAGDRSFIDTVNNLTKKPIMSDTGWIEVGVTNPSDPDYDISPPFLNGWASVVAGNIPPMSFYLSHDGETRIRGMITGGVAGTVAFILPTGYRPEYTERFVVPNDVSGETAIVQVDPNGNVTILSDTVAPTSTITPRTIGELGTTVASNQATTLVHTVDFNDLPAGDGILVMAMAPSLPVLAGTQGFPTSCTDSAGNSYSTLLQKNFQAASPVANEGVYIRLFWCGSSSSTLVDGTGTITVTWDNPVWDRCIYAVQVRREGGSAHTPIVLASTANNDAAVYASSQVTLGCPAWTPTRDQALVYSLVISARPLPTYSVSYGGVGGYSGFYEATSDVQRGGTGSKESYSIHHQTHGSDVYVKVGANPATEYDLGLLAATFQASFNGSAQNYGKPPFPSTPDTNVWKGIILLGID